jgi:gas vesicle protein
MKNSLKEIKMNNNSGKDFGTFLAGFLVGGLAGAGVAFLLAPQSGEETREHIRRRAVEARDKVQDTVKEARAKSEAIAADVKNRAEEIQVKSQVILEQGQKHLAQALEETKKAAAAATSEGEKLDTWEKQCANLASSYQSER